MTYVKKLAGRRYNIDRGIFLSDMDDEFYLCLTNFPSSQVKPFIDYLMSGCVLDWKWNTCDGDCSHKYTYSEDNITTVSGDFSLINILQGIENEKWDPSEVLYDFALYYKDCRKCNASNMKRETLYEDVKKLILEGFTVKVKVHSGNIMSMYE